MKSEEIATTLQWLTSEVSIQPPTLGVWIAFAIVLVLLLCSGFVSASEIAFFSLNPTDRSTIDEEKHPADRKVAALLDDSERLLATILISNNLVNVAVIIILNFCFVKTIDFGQAKWLEFICSPSCCCSSAKSSPRYTAHSMHSPSAALQPPSSRP